MTPNQAVIQASKTILEAGGLAPHPRLLKALASLPALSLKEEESEALSWRDHFARCFAVEDGPNLGRLIQSTLKEMGLEGKSDRLADLLDHAQGRCLIRGSFQAALGLESLREEAEALLGAPLSEHGLRRGSIIEPAVSKKGYGAALRGSSPTVPAQALALEMARLSEKAGAWRIVEPGFWAPALSESEQAEQKKKQESVASAALRAVQMDESAHAERLEKTMVAARICAQAGAQMAQERERAGEPECLYARELESFAGRLCARLLAKGANVAWLYEEHGIVWSDGAASLIEGLGESPVRGLFWMGLESESLLIASELSPAAPREPEARQRRAL